MVGWVGGGTLGTVDGVVPLPQLFKLCGTNFNIHLIIHSQLCQKQKTIRNIIVQEIIKINLF